MKKQETVTVKYNGIEFEVVGMYSAGYYGTHETPPESPSFEIEQILYKGVDVWNVMEAVDSRCSFANEIENLIIENYDNTPDHD